MKAFIVYWHPEPKSFNHAMFLAASKALTDAGWEVKTSDLCSMSFDPVSGRKNFRTVKDPNYLKLQIEEMHAAEVKGFSPDLEEEMQKLEWCDLMIWQFPFWWFGLPAALKGCRESVGLPGCRVRNAHLKRCAVRTLLSAFCGTAD